MKENKENLPPIKLPLKSTKSSNVIKELRLISTKLQKIVSLKITSWFSNSRNNKIDILKTDESQDGLSTVATLEN